MSSHGLELVPFVGVEAKATTVLEDIVEHNAFFGGEAGVNTMELQLFDAHVVDILVQVGAFDRQASEFGEVMLAVRAEALSWSLGLILGDACHITHLPVVDPLEATSKLELALALVVDGWTLVQEPTEKHTIDSPKHLSTRMLSRSSLYFKVFLLLPAMWTKKAPFILHNMTEAYYRCCLHLSDLSALHTRGDLMLLREKHFAVIHAGGELPLLMGEARAEARAILDAIIDDEAVGEQLVLAVVAPPWPAHVADLDDVDVGVPAPMQPCTIQFGGHECKFDGASHASGIPRGYVHCRSWQLHGKNCWKYRQVSGFRTYKECAAWLLAWELEGQAPNVTDQLLHRYCSPSPDKVADILRQLG